MTTTRAPDFLIEEMVKHIEHDLRTRGRAVARQAIVSEVLQRLAVNEYFIFNPVSKAHMEIDFSPLNSGENPPSRSVVADSAKYAAVSLESEEGIDELSYDIARARVVGADYVYILQARFLKHQQPQRFYGLIGFADSSWFYIYYTGSGENELDDQEAGQIFHSIRIIRGGKG